VPADGHTYNGIGHAGETIAAAAVPELFNRALRDIADFAHRVAARSGE
jgi:acetyl esterase